MFIDRKQTEKNKNDQLFEAIVALSYMLTTFFDYEAEAEWECCYTENEVLDKLEV